MVYILLTIWLVQRGSAQSKEPGRGGPETDEEQQLGWHAQPNSPKWAKAGGWRTWTFSWSLTFLMLAIFLGSWGTQLVAGWAAYNESLLQQMQDPLTVPAHLFNADFWSRSLQNWQSEFLAVGSMAIFAVFLRQRGSPQSKPVGTPHEESAAEG